MMAIEGGDIQVLQYLLQCGASPMQGNANGLLPIHRAVLVNSRLLLAFLLLEAGVSVDTRDAKGATALTWASYKKNSELVSFLLKEGAHPLASDNGGRIALHWAAVNGDLQTIDALLDHGQIIEQLSAKCLRGLTPEQYARKAKNVQVMNHLSMYRDMHNNFWVSIPSSYSPSRLSLLGPGATGAHTRH